jgi:tetratricopeptide (TPR) repeat protein
MKKEKMDYQGIIDVCKIIGVCLTVIGTIVAIIGLWAYLKNREVKKIENQIEENRTVKIENDVNDVKNDLVNIKDDVVEEVLKRILDEKRQISINYGDLSKEEQDKVLRERFSLSSEEIEGLIKKAIKRTKSYLTQAMGYELKYDYDNAIKLYKKALGEATSYKDKAWILAQIGMQYMDLRIYVEAKRNYELSLEFYDKVEDKSENYLNNIAAIYNDLGIIDRNNGSYLKAIDNHKKALIIRENLIKISRDNIF